MDKNMGSLALDADRVFSNLAPFKEFIHQRCGLTFEHMGDGLLIKALSQRMAILGITGDCPEVGASYLARLQRDESEFHYFTSLITINETYFFREPEQIRLVIDTLLPRLLTNRPANKPIRIFSVGCSTGEEPYSIALALHEKFGDTGTNRFQIIAGDLDQQALGKAREGRYSTFSFRNALDERYRRYFKSGENGLLQLIQTIQNQVQFCYFNLLTDPYPIECHYQDIIFFRNVSLYFDRNTRKILLSRLADLLNQPGYLFVGTSETLSSDFGRLYLQGENNAYYFTNTPQPDLNADGSSTIGHNLRASQAKVPPLPSLPTTQYPATPTRAITTLLTPSLLMPGLPRINQATAFLPVPDPAPQAPTHKGAIAPPPDFQKLLILVREKRYDQALAAIQKGLAHQPNDYHLRHLKAYLHFHRRQLEEAEQEVKKVLEEQPWSLDAFLLLGKIYHYANRTKEAIYWFQKALYVQSGCWEAHYYLADIYLLTGQPEQAAREYRLVLKQMTSTNANDSETSFFPLAVPLTEVGALCKHHLATLPVW
ncbi:chemotaxis protein methyltransferase CheR [Gammaproteobacteria bacterium]